MNNKLPLQCGIGICPETLNRHTKGGIRHNIGQFGLTTERDVRYSPRNS